MKASTLFLGFTLVALAAALAGLWQAFGPRPAPSARTAPPAAETRVQRPQPMEPSLAEPTEPGVRSVYPGGRPSAAARPTPPESPPPVSARPAPPEPAPAPAPADPALAPERSAALPPSAPPAQGETPDASAGDGIDLNTASLEALNGLGAGMIGKTIIANRPYASPDELVTRRVLKRQDFETIKPRVVVR